MAAGKQVTTSKPQDLAAFDPHSEVPDYLRNLNRGSLGIEGVSIEDSGIPSIILLQPASTIITDGNFPTAQAGNFWHTGWDAQIGKDFEFIISRAKTRFVLHDPQDRKKIYARADDGVHWDVKRKFKVTLKGGKQVEWDTTPGTVKSSGLDQWGSFDPGADKQLPAATKYFDYLLYLPEMPEFSPVVFSLYRTKIQPARQQLHQKINLAASRGCPMQGVKFQAKVISVKGEEGTFYNVQFFMAGRATVEEANFACDLYERFENFTPKDVDLDLDEGEGTPTQTVNPKAAASAEY